MRYSIMLSRCCRRFPTQPPPMIFCLMDAEEWDSRQHESLVAVPGPEGFVHCCDKQQMSFRKRELFPNRIDCRCSKHRSYDA